MEDNYRVYQHTNLINGKKYIGITKQPVEQRFGTDGCNYRTSPHFYSAIKKYGWENFQHDILYDNLSKEEACDLEIQLIKENKTQDHRYGYNVMEGGNTPTMPESIRNIISEKLKGNKNGLGKVCSEEKKKKISDAQKGRKFSDEHKEKISLSKRGKSHTPPSEETRKKISDAHKKKRVYCKELDRVFISIQECARELGIYATTICACCKGRIKSHKGLHFCYYDNI